nr:unnamed protein product [Spirometra erinaceieuropaei]
MTLSSEESNVLLCVSCLRQCSRAHLPGGCSEELIPVFSVNSALSSSVSLSNSTLSPRGTPGVTDFSSSSDVELFVSQTRARSHGVSDSVDYSTEPSPPAAAEQPVSTGVLESRLLPCPKCVRVVGSAVGMKLHFRSAHPELYGLPSVYDPPTTNQSTRPTDDSDVINCQYCEKTFPTSRGCSMHTKSAHPDEYHRNRIHLAPVRSVWTPQEDNLLCSRAAALLADGQLSLPELARRLQGVFPTRSAEAIYKRLSKMEKDDLLLRNSVAATSRPTVRSPPNSTPPSNNPTEESETVDYRSQLLRTAVTQLTDSPCQALASDDIVSLAVDPLMGEIDTAHAHRRMDAHAKNVFPRRWRPGVNRRPKTDKPRNKRELRKAQYAEVQARLAKRPKLAAQFVLSGDWRSASGAEPPRPAGTLESNF